jgi:hypothetical protein
LFRSMGRVVLWKGKGSFAVFLELFLERKRCYRDWGKIAISVPYYFWATMWRVSSGSRAMSKTEK